jgi:hypothetical protein
MPFFLPIDSLVHDNPFGCLHVVADSAPNIHALQHQLPLDRQHQSLPELPAFQGYAMFCLHCKYHLSSTCNRVCERQCEYQSISFRTRPIGIFHATLRIKSYFHGILEQICSDASNLSMTTKHPILQQISNYCSCVSVVAYFVQDCFLSQAFSNQCIHYLLLLRYEGILLLKLKVVFRRVAEVFHDTDVTSTRVSLKI